MNPMGGSAVLPGEPYSGWKVTGPATELTLSAVGRAGSGWVYSGWRVDWTGIRTV